MSTPENLLNRLPRRTFKSGAPFVLSLPHMPFVGCFGGGDGMTYVGKKFAKRPDFDVLNHIKQFKKDFEEKVILAEIAKLNDLLRPPALEILKVRWIAEVAEALDAFVEFVAEITEEINAAIEEVNSRIDELNAARAEIEAVPEEARDLVQQHLLNLYDRCFGKLEAQAERLQSLIDCLGVF